MALGRKTGGRKSGSRNKDKQTVRDQMGQLGANPIEALIRIAGKAEEVEEYQVAVKCYSELCDYAFPKLRAITVAGNSATPFEININRSIPLPDSLKLLWGCIDGAGNPVKAVNQRDSHPRPRCACAR